MVNNKHHRQNVKTLKRRVKWYKKRQASLPERYQDKIQLIQDLLDPLACDVRPAKSSDSVYILIHELFYLRISTHRPHPSPNSSFQTLLSYDVKRHLNERQVLLDLKALSEKRNAKLELQVHNRWCDLHDLVTLKLEDLTP